MPNIEAGQRGPENQAEEDLPATGAESKEDNRLRVGDMVDNIMTPDGPRACEIIGFDETTDTVQVRVPETGLVMPMAREFLYAQQSQTESVPEPASRKEAGIWTESGENLLEKAAQTGVAEAPTQWDQEAAARGQRNQEILSATPTRTVDRPVASAEQIAAVQRILAAEKADKAQEGGEKRKIEKIGSTDVRKYKVGERSMIRGEMGTVKEITPNPDGITGTITVERDKEGQEEKMAA